MPGRLAIVLHTHMPDVEGKGVWPFGEQWLWEAVAESYVRVADVVRGHPVTIGVTPVLADQFDAMRGPAGDRFVAWVNDSREYVFGEDMGAFHQVGRGDLHDALEPQLADYRSAAVRFENEFDRNLNAMFDDLGASGAELIGGPATHPVLPLLATDYGLDLQLRTGMRSHVERFGRSPGAWLPECAYDRGVGEALARNGIKYFCVDQSAVLGEDSLDNLELSHTPAGPIAIPIDWFTIANVWREDGYPAVGTYRSSFARTIHDLLPWNNDGNAWSGESARAQAEAHAAAFLRGVVARLEVYEAERGRDGLVVFAADTELFGHWWYEGPWWLNEVLRLAPEYGIELVTLGQAVADGEPVDRALERASWGRDKTLVTWDSPKVAQFAWRSRSSELQLEAALLAGAPPESEPVQRAEHELLSMQASDWAFMADREQAGDYPSERFAGHLAGFERAISAVRESVEGEDGLHPQDV
jgi:1,4-alpha-glucan branching enzyme